MLDHTGAGRSAERFSDYDLILTSLELQSTKRDLADAIIDADNSLIRNLD